MKRSMQGPPINATFFVEPKGVVKVSLSLLKPTDKFSWDIVEQSPAKNIAPSVDEWVDAYCSKVKSLPHVPVLLEDLPTYTRQVLECLYKLPFASRVTYQELARLTGREKAARPAGSACGRNPCPLLIPCHHVFAANGLGGFSLGLDMKKALLNFEA